MFVNTFLQVVLYKIFPYIKIYLFKYGVKTWFFIVDYIHFFIRFYIRFCILYTNLKNIKKCLRKRIDTYVFMWYIIDTVKQKIKERGLKYELSAVCIIKV